MKLYYLFEEILNELSGEEIYQKYYAEIPKRVFINIVASDPRSKISDFDGEIKKVGKYSKLLLNLFQKGKLRVEDLTKAREYLTYVYKYNIPLDVNKINELGDIFNLVKKYIVKEKPDNLSNIVSSLDEKDYELLYNGENWVIYTPNNEKAACYLGGGTQWCTTYGKHSLNKDYQDRSSYFKNYNKQGDLYIIINKSNANEKYQFHFESEQYMDADDRSIDINEFLENNSEIKYFFFPSFIKKVDEETRKEQLHKMKILSDKDRNDLLVKIIDEEDMKKPIINYVINNNEDGLKEVIKDDNINFDIELNKLVINIIVIRGNLNDLDEVKDVISYLRTERNNSEEVRSRLHNEEYDWSEMLENDFKKYYDQNIRTNYAIDYNKFKEKYYEIFYKNDKIREQFIEDAIIKTNENYDAHIESILNDITRNIDFDSYTYETLDINLPKSSFILYVLENNITEIDDLDDFFENYISHYDIPTDLGYIEYFDYETEYPEYDIKSKESYSVSIDDFFDEIFENLEKSDKCLEKKAEFNKFLKKYFKETDFSYNNREITYDNENVFIQILSDLDCENNTIKIYYKNKKTDKTYQGEINVDNLSDYMFNYKLFESLINFKNLLK